MNVGSGRARKPDLRKLVPHRHKAGQDAPPTSFESLTVGNALMYRGKMPRLPNNDVLPPCPKCLIGFHACQMLNQLVAFKADQALVGNFPI